MMAYEFTADPAIVGSKEKSTIVLAKSVSAAIAVIFDFRFGYHTQIMLWTHALVEGKMTPHDYATKVFITCYRDGIVQSNGISVPGEIVPYEMRFMAADMVEKNR
jgi:hypothetical protein